MNGVFCECMTRCDCVVQKVRELDEKTTMDKEIADECLHQIMQATGWPEDYAKQKFSELCDLYKIKVEVC